MTERDHMVLVVVAAIPVAACQLIWGAYVTTVLWGWFVAGLFGAPDLTIPAAIGLGLMVKAFTWGSARHDQVDRLLNKGRSDAARFWSYAATGFFAPAFLLGVGAIVKQFM